MAETRLLTKPSKAEEASAAIVVALEILLHPMMTRLPNQGLALIVQ